jgi:hypothetical protein
MQQFPKGRNEILMTHVVQRCPNINQLDRDILAYIQGVSSNLAVDTSLLQLQDEQSITDRPGKQSNTSTADMLALTTLAEVSGRHLDYSSQQAPQDFAFPAHDSPSIPNPTHAGPVAESNLLDSIASHRSPEIHQGHAKRNATRARGKFTDIRRKEVSEIRKRGACLRCRMLKKPCSEGTPCSTCANVESARLWKGQCIRTRLADELSLYNTHLFHARADLENPLLLQGTIGQASTSYLEVEARTSGVAVPSLALLAKSHSNAHTSEGRLWSIADQDGLMRSLEMYVETIAPVRAEVESTSFMRATLQSALVLSENAAESPNNTGGVTSRSCYNLRNELLALAVKLWTATDLLTTENAFHVKITDNNRQGDTVEANRLNVRKDTPPKPLEYDLGKHQLYVALEQLCSSLAKNVVTELERRLLQRQQVSRFATFLSAVLLLRCVERMTAFFETLQAEGKTWPLDHTAKRLSQQGEHFAQLLITLLRMRNLPPKLTILSDGTLGTMQDDAAPPPVHNTELSAVTSPGSSAMNAARWLERAGLLASDLSSSIRSNEDRDVGIDAWDLAFVSKLLLPETGS